jgi:hypothetical protein
MGLGVAHPVFHYHNRLAIVRSRSRPCFVIVLAFDDLGFFGKVMARAALLVKLLLV